MSTKKILNCFCGAAAEKDESLSQGIYYRCSNEDCEVFGPNNDPTGEKWNALMGKFSESQERLAKVRDAWVDWSNSFEPGHLVTKEEANLNNAILLMETFDKLRPYKPSEPAAPPAPVHPVVSVNVVQEWYASNKGASFAPEIIQLCADGTVWAVRLDTMEQKQIPPIPGVEEKPHHD